MTWCPIKLSKSDFLKRDYGFLIPKFTPVNSENLY